MDLVNITMLKTRSPTKENGSEVNNTDSEKKLMPMAPTTKVSSTPILTSLGNFKSSEKQGKGGFKWQDGASYVGEFKNNNIEGEGTYTWSDQRKFVG